MSPIERLQLDLAARADDHFPYITVNVTRPRAATTAVLIQTAINNALSGLTRKNGKGGVTILANMPEIKAPNQEEAGPQLTMLPWFRVIENPLINEGANGTGMSAEEVVDQLLQLMHDFFDQGASATLLAGTVPAKSQPDFTKLGQVAYDVYFERFLHRANPVKTKHPKISGTASAVTITCPDGSAEIYYTTDGSYPSRPTAYNSSTAILLNPDLQNIDGSPVLNVDGNPIRNVASAFPVAAGTLVRAVAFANNQQASNLAASTIPNS